jgi:hypothetical protein
MRVKQFLILSLLLVLVPLSLAIEDRTIINDHSLGTFYLPFSGEEMLIEDAVVFVALFMILLALVYEIVNLLGFVEGLVIKIVFSVVFVLLANFNGIIYRAVLYLKDWQRVIELITSLTLVNIIFILIGLILIILFLVILRKLIAQWKDDEIKEAKEVDAINEGTRMKLKRIKNKYGLE